MRKSLIALAILGLLAMVLAGCGPVPPVVREFIADINTLALWHFNEADGQTIDDSSAGGFDLVLGDTAAVEGTDAVRIASGRDGFGNAIQCAGGVGGQRAYSGMAAPFPGDAFSLECWLRTTTAGLAMIINVGTAELQMNDSGQPVLSIAAPGWTDCVSSAVITDGNWHYVAVTYDGANLYIYVDGTQTGTLAVAATVGDPSEYFLGGRTSSHSFAGDLDEVRISSVARSATEIGDYYDTATS